MRTETAVEPHAHVVRPFERHHLGRENVGELARAATKSEGADSADCAGVAVRHRMGRAGKHDAEFGRHDMRYALLRIVDIEQPDAVLAAAFAHRLDEGGTRWIGRIVATRRRGDRMILYRERQIADAVKVPDLVEQ